MLLLLPIYLCLVHSAFSSSSPPQTFVLSGSANTYVAFEPWRPCLTGYLRFDVRTTSKDGTLAYIDDRGKFDFFYLRLIEGKLRLLFNLGSDRQAINVNMKINDDQWHTVLVKRNGQTTVLSIDNGFAQNSTITHSEDLYFGGAVHNEYDASPFYFGGIPSILERPSSGNLSSFDVYMQLRFQGQLRNVVYKNCTNSQPVQPVATAVSGGVSLIPNLQCAGRDCGTGVCLATETNYACLCDETNYQGTHCQSERQPNEFVFHGKQHLKYDLLEPIASVTEILTFEFKTNHYNGLLFQLIDSQIYIKLKQGQLAVEYRLDNHAWYEASTRDLLLVDDQWHYVQIKRKAGQVIVFVDQYYLPLENDLSVDQLFHFKEIFVGGNANAQIEKFYGCLKDISITFNESVTIDLNKSATNFQEHGFLRNRNCKSLLTPVQFLSPSSSSYISFQLRNISQHVNISFRFETYSSECILLFTQSTQHFLGFDLIDGFLYLTLNINEKRQRQELFQQRVNDGQSHHIQANLRHVQGETELDITMDHRQNTKVTIKDTPTKILLQAMTIGGINPFLSGLPANYFAGVMQRGLIGCFSDLEINQAPINLTKYINSTDNSVAPRSGPCSTGLSPKRPCLCEHQGECRLGSAGTWSCDCSKTGYTGRRCEQIAYHQDLSQMGLFEFNTNLQWSDHINDIRFGLQAVHDEINFLQIRPCRSSSKCDAIQFSIINGLLHVNFYSMNLTSEYPFLLDNQWHFIHLQRFDQKFLLHIDNHITQQRVPFAQTNLPRSSTIWAVLMGPKRVQIEDLRVYDQSIYSKVLLGRGEDQVKLKTRLWKPANTISFTEPQSSHVEIQLGEILCQDCLVDSIHFQFRTHELDGLLLLAMVRAENHRTSTSMDNTSTRNNQYLVLKLTNGMVHLSIVDASVPANENENHYVQSKLTVNDNHWHHISIHRASDYHLELQIDAHEYYLRAPISFLDKIYLGRPPETYFLQHLPTIKGCFASLTVNSQVVNLREYIRSNAPVRNDCFLDSQCPLQFCRNTGTCLGRNQCDCQHTSFQGPFCTDFKQGYAFNNNTPGLIFDQPFNKEKPLLLYQLSFGIITKVDNAEIIRVNEQISVELFRGSIRVILMGNEVSIHPRLVNNGYYHLVQMSYNLSGHLSLSVDNQLMVNQFNHRLSFDKPLLLLIGQNPMFTSPFQGQLYGLESDIYSIFDLISPTFHRISFAPIRNKSLSSPASPIITPSFRSPEEVINHPSCSYQPYDDICIVAAESNNASLLTFTNVSAQLSPPRRGSSPATNKPTFKPVLIGTTAYEESMENTSNASGLHDTPPQIVSVRTPLVTRLRERLHWRNIWVLAVGILLGVLSCVALCLCACMRYRRKDAGVYELEETQRFRPLIVEVPPSPGDNIRALINSSSKPTNIKSRQQRKRKKSPLLNAEEQREFYI